MRITRRLIIKAVGLIFFLAAVTNIIFLTVPDWSSLNQDLPTTVALETNYPTYFDNVMKPENHLKTAPHVASLFPVDTSLSVSLQPLPPRDSHSRERPESAETNPDILQRLTRWDNLSLGFHASSVGRLRKYEWRKKFSPYARSCNKSEVNSTVLWKKPAECYMEGSLDQGPRNYQKSGNNILFTVRTTGSLHSQRLPLIFQTWLSTINSSNVVLVTDEEDRVLKYRAQEAGIRIVASVPGYERLCEKAGDELSLMFLSGMHHYQWICHVDDDMYVNVEQLINMLSIFTDGQPVYFGRSGTFPGALRTVLNGVPLGVTGSSYDFAVGGLYCLNRLLLNMARRWLGGRTVFGRMCNVTKEPEDVTVGFVVGIILGLDLNHTLLIHSHGIDLHGVDSDTLIYQIGISYGFGNIQWGSKPNSVNVPYYLFSQAQDPSRFLSLHCHYHGEVDWCKTQKRKLLEKKYQLYSKNRKTNA